MSGRRALPALGTTGRPELVGLEGNVRRLGDQLHGQLLALDADDIAFSAAPADWVAPVPTTLGEAVRRLAAAAGAHPVP